MIEERKELVRALEKQGIRDVDNYLEIPPDVGMGDFALPCFYLAKKLKKSPNEIAEEIIEKWKPTPSFEKAENAGPYANFSLKRDIYTEKTLANVLKVGQNFGKGKQKGKALIEHTSINPNASPHVGRARNALIGDSIARILRFSGVDIEVHYLVNDIGKQISMLVLASKNKKVNFDGLLELYMEIFKKVEKSKKLEKEVLDLLEKLESGDEKTKKEFLKIVNTCLDGQKAIMSELGVEYDSFDFESEYLWSKKTKDVLEQLEKSGKVFTDDDNRKVLDLKGFDVPMEPPLLVLTRSDGTSLYPLRDLAYTKDKMKKGRNIVVLGEDHKLYFKQLSAALEIIGEKPPQPVHYSFVLLKEGKMSTRKGAVVLLSEFMEEALKKAGGEIKKRNKNIKKKELDKLAKTIGYGAVKYQIIKVSADKNVTFGWEDALSFEGESAPYIQYTHARIQSLLKKANKKLKKPEGFTLVGDEKFALVKQISIFPKLVADAAEVLKPHMVAMYVFKVAEMFNEIYHKEKIIGSDKAHENSMLVLAYSTAIVLSKGLYLIGIDSPNRM